MPSFPCRRIRSRYRGGLWDDFGRSVSGHLVVVAPDVWCYDGLGDGEKCSPRTKP